MRVDKYLWAIRYYKTRSQATAAIKQGKVRVNDAVVKPSREVYPLDILTVRKNQIDYKLEVLDHPKSRVGAKLVDLYRKDITSRDALASRELLAQSQDYYRKKGLGRPTKKDRRDLSDWWGQNEEE